MKVLDALVLRNTGNELPVPPPETCMVAGNAHPMNAPVQNRIAISTGIEIDRDPDPDSDSNSDLDFAHLTNNK